MAEVQTRSTASRGRGTGRGGRGGHSSRGGRSAPRNATTDASAAPPSLSLEEQGELGQLKKDHATELVTLGELFPDWTADDLVLALQDTNGDLAGTIEKISEGSVSQFSDVKKKTKPKKEAPIANESASVRGRSRGGESRSRGRANERPRGRAKASSAAIDGARAAAANTTSLPTTDASGWGSTETPNIGAWEDSANAASATAKDEPKSSLIPEGTKKSWASMLSQPKVVAVPKPASSVPAPALAVLDSLEPPATEMQLPLVQALDTTEAADLTPTRDQLTEDNLENIPDESVPVATETVASTRDPGSVVGGTPYASTQNLPATARPQLGGYATTAWKATGTPGRSASFRRTMDQREAVVMPGNHAVDRAAVQFGSLGLNGENKPADVEDEREEAQTRAPVALSPPTAPRTSLPPAPAQPPAESQALPTPKISSTFPISSQAPSNSIAAQSQYGKYGGASEKTYDPYNGQQGYGNDSYGQQPSNGPQSQSSYPAGPEYASQYGDSRSYQNYYSYGQTTQQDAGPQRTGSAFADSGYASTHNAQSRLSESQNSGHTTPNPTSTQQGPAAQSHQQPGHQGYPYNPYYGGSYYGNSYMNQVRGPLYFTNQYSNNYYNQQGYPYGKGNVYGQPHGYGISPQGSYEQTTPANTTSYGRDSGDYRSSSQQVQSSSAYGQAESYGKSSSYGQSQGQQYGQNDESLKSYADSKGGPSPSMAHAGRAGSASNHNSNHPPQSQQSYGGYPNHLGQGSGYGGGAGNPGGHHGNTQNQSGYPYGNNYNYGRGWSGYGH